MASTLDKFRKAVQMSVEGDPVTLSIKGAEGEEYRIMPRKFSKKHAAKLRSLLLTSASHVPPALQSKIMKIKAEHGTAVTEEILSEALTEDELAALMTSGDAEGQYEVERRKIIYGVAWHDFGGAEEPMSEDVADLILESRAIAEEVLDAVDAMNPPYPDQTSSSSGT